MKETIAICLLLLLFVGSNGQGHPRRVKAQVVASGSAVQEGWIKAFEPFDSSPPSFVILYEDSAAAKGKRITAKCGMKIKTQDGQMYMASLRDDYAIVHTSIREESNLLKYYFLELIVDGKYNVVRNYHGNHDDYYEMHFDGPYFEWYHMLQRKYKDSLTTLCLGREVFEKRFIEMLHAAKFTTYWQQYLLTEIRGPNACRLPLVEDFNKAADSTEKGRRVADLLKYKPTGTGLEILHNNSPSSRRCRAQIVFSNFSTEDGWIDSLRSNDSIPPSFITLYKDSLSTEGKIIPAAVWMKIYVPGGTSYMASVREDCSDIHIYANMQDERYPYVFLPLLADGKYCMVSNNHGDHTDLYILLREADQVEIFQLLKYSNTSGVPYDCSNRGARQLFIHLMNKAFFTPLWKEYIRARIDLPQVDVAAMLKDFNMAAVESSKTFKEAYNAGSNDFFEQGIDRTRISIGVGSSLAYGKLYLPDLRDFKGTAPISALFITADAIERDFKRQELGFRFHGGFSQHSFRQLRFNSWYIGGTVLIGWPLGTRKILYLGPTAKYHWLHWSPNAAKRLKEELVGDPLMPGWLNYGVMGSVQWKKSNWEFGFEWTTFNDLDFGHRVRKTGTISLYAIKRFECYIDQIGDWIRARRYARSER